MTNLYSVERMSRGDRQTIELEIAGAAVCWEPALRIALKVLPPNIIEDEWASIAFYWAAAQLDKKQFEGVTNPDRLLAAMDHANYPTDCDHYTREAMTEALWTPRMYDDKTIRSLCETLRDEHLAWQRMVQVARQTVSNPIVQRLLRETAPPPPVSRPLRPQKEVPMRGGVE